MRRWKCNDDSKFSTFGNGTECKSGVTQTFIPLVDCNSRSNQSEDIDQQNTITTIHINIKIVGKPMLDKFLTCENVKVNGKTVGHQHILRILLRNRNKANKWSKKQVFFCSLGFKLLFTNQSLEHIPK